MEAYTTFDYISAELGDGTISISSKLTLLFNIMGVMRNKKT